MSLSRPFAAEYSGECAYCDGSIYEGDWIRMGDNGPVHEECAGEVDDWNDHLDGGW